MLIGSQGHALQSLLRFASAVRSAGSWGPGAKVEDLVSVEGPPWPSHRQIFPDLLCTSLPTLPAAYWPRYARVPQMGAHEAYAKSICCSARPYVCIRAHG